MTKGGHIVTMASEVEMGVRVEVNPLAYDFAAPLVPDEPPQWRTIRVVLVGNHVDEVYACFDPAEYGLESERDDASDVMGCLDLVDDIEREMRRRFGHRAHLRMLDAEEETRLLARSRAWEG